MSESLLALTIAIIAGVISSRSDELFRAIITTEIILIYYEMLRR